MPIYGHYANELTHFSQWLGVEFANGCVYVYRMFISYTLAQLHEFVIGSRWSVHKLHG